MELNLPSQSSRTKNFRDNSLRLPRSERKAFYYWGFTLYTLLVLVVLELLVPSFISAYIDLHLVFVVATILIAVKTILVRSSR